MDESFSPDLGELKRKFYTKSRELHPDYYAQESQAKQEEVIALSAFNNEAYNTLKDEDALMEYILKLHNVLGGEGENKLDQMFLMEVMDINENLMDLQMDFDQDKYDKVLEEINALKAQLYKDVAPTMELYDEDKKVERLKIIKEYFLKKKYLLRIKDNLDKFAHN